MLISRSNTFCETTPICDHIMSKGAPESWGKHPKCQDPVYNKSCQDAAQIFGSDREGKFSVVGIVN